MSWRLAIALLLCLFVVACADRPNDSDNNRFGGFYAGGSLGGGASR